MLTNQHRFVARMINCSQRTDYKKHMCGVCHALGDEYGMLSRLITNHEIILLNMLTEAQCQQLPPEVLRRCPLNPTQQVRTNQTVSSRFAAAIAVLLVNTSVEDDLRDGKGLQLPTRLLKAMITRLATTAGQTLSTLSFDTSRLLSLQDEQSYAEAQNSNPLIPSMQSSATIFAMTGNLAGQPHNQPALAAIGANYGAYLYLLDALKDYSADYNNRQYNPLLDYAQASQNVLTLTQTGVDWLKAQLTDILNNIRDQLATLQLHHYQDSIHKMLTEPLQRLIIRLNRVTDGIHYAQITRHDILKSLLFMSEGKKPEGDSVDDFFNDEETVDHPTKQRGKKGKKRGDSSNNSCCGDSDDAADVGFYACFYGDSCNACDSDCDGKPDCVDTNVSGCGGCGGDGCDIGGCDGCGDGGCDLNCN